MRGALPSGSGHGTLREPGTATHCMVMGLGVRSQRSLAWASAVLDAVLWVGPAGADSPQESPDSPTSTSNPTWHYGAWVDLAYAIDPNFPENHRWRSKTTTPRVNELAPNIVVGYVRKDVTIQSRWGLELGLQAGYDTNGLVPETIPGRDKPVPGADTLRHFSLANISYLAPVGSGLTLTAGLFNSYIGYQSFFPRYNLN